MIQVVPIRYDYRESHSHIRTHTLNPHLGITITITIEGPKENIISILEDHLLETISGTEWDSADSDSDFTFLTENYNRFVRNLEPSDLAGVSIIISLLKDSSLTVSAVGNATAFLVEGEDITQITAPEKGRYDFHTLTTGEVSRNAVIYLSNKNVQEVLGNGLLIEFSSLPKQEFIEVIETLLRREVEDSLHVIRVAHSFKVAQSKEKRRGRGQLDLIKNKGISATKYIKNLPVWGKVKSKIDDIDLGKNNKHKYAFLSVGGVLLFLLLIILIQAIANAISGNYENNKTREEILQAQTLIEESQKLTGNPTAFDQKIKEAKDLLFRLRKEDKYVNEIQTLENRIEVLKKEVYDIQTVNLNEKQTIVPIDEDFSAMNTFSVSNKLLIIGKNGAIVDYIPGNKLPNIIPYPQNDQAINTAINDSGIPFIVSKEGRIMTLRQNQMTYINVIGQAKWEVGEEIQTYNNNLYFLNDTRNQIYKHRPGANGFSQKTNVFPKLSSEKILDFSIDGGYYLLFEDGSVGRYVSIDKDGIKKITLNKVPSAWSIDASKGSQIIGTSNLSYVYIRNNDKIWIFQANSKRFQDINALTYVGQLEIQTNDTLQSISVPRDGLIYITTDKGIFDTQFEILDGKLILK